MAGVFFKRKLNKFSVLYTVRYLNFVFLEIGDYYRARCDPLASLTKAVDFQELLAATATCFFFYKHNAYKHK